MIGWNLKGKIINVKAAFLYGGLKEEIILDISPGMEADKDESLISKKTIYGLVQIARQVTQCFHHAWAWKKSIFLLSSKQLIKYQVVVYDYL